MATVLVVDDHPDTCRAMSVLVRRMGHRAICSNSGSDAIAQISKQTPDLVLLDLMMPEMDGFEVLRHIRSDPATFDMRVIVFSAVENPELRDKATEAGANGYWLKAQLDATEIRNRLNQYLMA